MTFEVPFTLINKKAKDLFSYRHENKSFAFLLRGELMCWDILIYRYLHFCFAIKLTLNFFHQNKLFTFFNSRNNG